MVRAAIGLTVVAVAASSCGSSQRGTVSPPMPGTVPSTPAQSAIARVQSVEGQLVGIFPQAEVRLGCRIPATLRPLRGTCETRVEFRKGSGVAVVTFTEFWPAAKFRTRASTRGTLHHSWSFEVRRNGRVVSAGSRGDFPPQASN